MVQGTTKVEAQAQTHAADNARAGKQKKELYKKKPKQKTNNSKQKRTKLVFFVLYVNFCYSLSGNQNAFIRLGKTSS